VQFLSDRNLRTRYAPRWDCTAVKVSTTLFVPTRHHHYGRRIRLMHPSAAAASVRSSRNLETSENEKGGEWCWWQRYLSPSKTTHRSITITAIKTKPPLTSYRPFRFSTTTTSLLHSPNDQQLATTPLRRPCSRRYNQTLALSIIMRIKYDDHSYT